MLIAANGHDPVDVLAQAAGLGPLDQARDRAAVIDYRLDLTQANNRTRGPLPWLPGIPTQLLDDPTWEDYLTGRYQLTRQLADETRQRVADDPAPARWAEDLSGLDPALVTDIQLWRAAHQTPDNDVRPHRRTAILRGRTRRAAPSRPRRPHQPGRHPRMAPQDHH